MEKAESPARHQEHKTNPLPLQRGEEADICALQEENAQLRRLVIQLSKLVIKNVMDHK